MKLAMIVLKFKKNMAAVIKNRTAGQTAVFCKYLKNGKVKQIYAVEINCLEGWNLPMCEFP